MDLQRRLGLVRKHAGFHQVPKLKLGIMFAWENKIKHKRWQHKPCMTKNSEQNEISGERAAVQVKGERWKKIKSNPRLMYFFSTDCSTAYLIYCFLNTVVSLHCSLIAVALTLRTKLCLNIQRQHRAFSLSVEPPACHKIQPSGPITQPGDKGWANWGLHNPLLKVYLTM